MVSTGCRYELVTTINGVLTDGVAGKTHVTSQARERHLSLVMGPGLECFHCSNNIHDTGHRGALGVVYAHVTDRSGAGRGSVHGLQLRRQRGPLRRARRRRRRP